LRELACRVEARLLIGGERYSQGAEAGPHRHEPQTDAIVRGQRLSAGRQAAPVSCARPCRARSAPGSPRPPAASDQRLGSLGKKSRNTAISFFAPSKSRAMRE
jgi:hypothetical protein